MVYASSIAASILLLFSLSVLKTDQNNFDSLDTQTVENYIIEENVITPYDLATLMGEEELFESGLASTNFDESHIETFLVEHLDLEELLVD